MKKKTPFLSVIICLVLIAALVLSVLSLREAKSNLAVLEAQLRSLQEENQQLSNLNEALRLQLDSYFLSQNGTPYVEEDYCSLIVENWSVANSTLTVEALAQVFFTLPTEFSATLELWRGDAVLSSQPVTLNATEADTVYEATLCASFAFPTIKDGEELQLCLMIQPTAGDAIYAYGAGWYLQNGELMVITG